MFVDKFAPVVESCPSKAIVSTPMSGQRSVVFTSDWPTVKFSSAASRIDANHDQGNLWVFVVLLYILESGKTLRIFFLIITKIKFIFLKFICGFDLAIIFCRFFCIIIQCFKVWNYSYSVFVFD